ncbi:DUF362 domain-containing protein [Methanolobus sp. ZRKC3]|uniref:DUF362 domain-containing protein n=1 Tax=Methanolobus sp. ZRKC3 TaxID=3125786 RepID=UPI00324CAB9C
MSEVYFTPAEEIGPENTQVDQIVALFPKMSPVRKGDIVAIKIHPGEYGNTTYVRPIIVKTVVDMVKAAGGIPFVTDTTVLYRSRRFNAVEVIETAAANGFTHASMGAPIICADGLHGDDSVTVELGGERLKDITVASVIAAADSMIVISHCKGHPASGFGGAIKNLGMGCLDKAGKAKVHAPGIPEVDAEKCVGCGACVKYCPWDVINLESGKAIIDKSKCKGETACMTACKYAAIASPAGYFKPLQELLGEASMGPVKALGSRIGYINWIFDLTPGCDCFNFSAPVFAGDVGILASKDPVAIDKASIDLINKKMHNENSGTIDDVWGVDPVIHVDHAAKIGAGSLKYTLMQ